MDEKEPEPYYICQNRLENRIFKVSSWHPARPSRSLLNPEEYEIMFSVEGSHWLYLGMQTITERLLNRWCAAKSRLNILDAGCGTGAGMTTYLTHYGDVTGVDISEIALGFCRKRGAKRLSRASVTDLPFASGIFDLVTSFDVLYEQAVTNDLRALTEFSRVLKIEGYLLLRLPAFNWMRGQHDLVTHTARRYVRSQVSEMLQECGFEAGQITYANMFLFPAALLKRALERFHENHEPKSDLTIGVGPFNKILKGILSLEASLISKGNLPFGLSVIAIAQKKQNYG
jgi:ubiquinone/menaquinone biosynthesis C-methylase UbiE